MACSSRVDQGGQDRNASLQDNIGIDTKKEAGRGIVIMVHSSLVLRIALSEKSCPTR